MSTAHDLETTAQEKFEPNTIKILLADDHRSFIDGLQLVIDTQKPRMEIVGTATTIIKALTEAIRLEPDVVLLDLNFGDASGMDILPALVEKTAAKILILTGVCDPGIHDAAIMNGAQGVIFKDESAGVIIKAIERVNAGGVWIDSQILERVLGQNSKSETKSIDPNARKNIDSLTPRERQILKTLHSFEGSSDVEIAARLGISKYTLKNNFSAIYNKIEVKNRVQLMRFIFNHEAELNESNA